MSTVEKGTGLEVELSALFEQNGYTVRHNAKMEGRSGAVHQIDVHATYETPLYKTTVLIEAKNHQSNIDKDTVMKLASIRDDLSAGHAILATTSGFTPGALKTAALYGNIDLWDGSRTASLLDGIRRRADDGPGGRDASALPLAVQARVGADEARATFAEAVAKRAKGGFMGHGKVTESIVAVDTVWHPYYDVDLDAEVRIVEKTGWRSKEEAVHTVQARVTFDAATGAIASVGADGMTYDHAALATLDGAQRSLLRAVGGDKFEKRAVAVPGVGPGKVGQMINDMAAKGVLMQTEARPATYKAVHPYPGDPSSLGSVGGTHSVSRTDVGATGGERLDPGAVAEAAGTYWRGVRVKSIECIYYPYHVATVEREGGARRALWLDAVTGSRCPHFE